MLGLAFAGMLWLALRHAPDFAEKVATLGWSPAPPPPQGDPEHPILAEPAVKALVNARGTEHELRDRVQVPPTRPAPFLELPVEEGASPSLLERMLSARGRW